MVDYIEKYKVKELTPVEAIDGWLYKRDDLYMPFPDVPLSGGKVRQAISLIGGNYDYIKNECNGQVYTATAITSPQGIIIAKVANEFGFQSHIYLGTGSLKSVRENPLTMQILMMGGRIHLNKGCGYDSMLSAKIKALQDSGEKLFHVKFGINLEQNPEAILDSIGFQVQNIPKDLDYLIIPCGSCITMSGIIRGLLEYDIHPKHIVGVQISGYDRTKQLRKILGDDLDRVPWELKISKEFNYHTPCNIWLPEGTRLDVLYESKCMSYVRNFMSDELKDKKVLFWLVGNSSAVRFSNIVVKEKKNE